MAASYSARLWACCPVAETLLQPASLLMFPATAGFLLEPLEAACAFCNLALFLFKPAAGFQLLALSEDKNQQSVLKKATQSRHFFCYPQRYLKTNDFFIADRAKAAFLRISYPQRLLKPNEFFIADEAIFHVYSTSHPQRLLKASDFFIADRKSATSFWLEPTSNRG